MNSCAASSKLAISTAKFLRTLADRFTGGFGPTVTAPSARLLLRRNNSETPLQMRDGS
jgi:hypothetical protein